MPKKNMLQIVLYQTENKVVFDTFREQKQLQIIL